MKSILKLSLFTLVAIAFTACNDIFDDPKQFPPQAPPPGAKIISIAELKESLWKLPNFLTGRKGVFGDTVTDYEVAAWASWIREDVYIKGRVISDDREGNFYKQLFIQDEGRDRFDTIYHNDTTYSVNITKYEPTGIVVKLGLNGLYNFYKLGQTIYVKCNNLVLGFYRGSYEIGYDPDQETYYPTSYIDIPTLINNHILAGDPQDLQPVTAREVTVAHLTRYLSSDSRDRERVLDSIKKDMLLGTLIKIKGLTFESTDQFLGNIYPVYRDGNGNKIEYGRDRRTGVEIDTAKFSPQDIITTWGLPVYLLTEIAGKDTVLKGNSKVVFLRGNGREVVTHSTSPFRQNFPLREQNLIFVPRNVAASVSHYYTQTGSNNTVIVRTSGFARFGGLPRQSAGDFTGIIGIYTSRNGGFPDFQLSIRDLNDVQ